MKFIHIADVHYGVRPDKGKPWSDTRALEVIETFKDILGVVEKSGADLLLIAGDLFHHIPTVAEIEEVDYMLSKLSKARTVIIAGNHDFMPLGSPLEVYRFRSKTVCLPPGKISNVYLKDINTCITGYSYGEKEITENIFEGIAPAKEGAINILLAHAGDAKHIPFNKEELKNSGFDYIALGHIHKPEIIESNLMAYSGSIEPIDYTDVGKRGYIFGEINNTKRIVFKQFNKRSYFNIGLEINAGCTNEMIIDTFENGIKKLGEENIFRLILRGRKSNNLNIDLRRLEKNYNIYEIVDNVYKDYDIEQLYKENSGNIIGRYIENYIDKQDDEISKKALQYGIEAILAGGIDRNVY